MCDQHTVNLDLNCVGAFTPEVAQRKVLLDLLEQQFNHPAILVNRCDQGGRQRIVVAQMEQATIELAQNSGPRQHYYLGRLDSVQTSLRFLAQEQLPGVQAGYSSEHDHFIPGQIDH